MIVVDVGCARWGTDYSVERLIQRFHPDVLVGFDPASTVSEAMPAVLGETNVALRREAAWTYDGTVGFHEQGSIGHVSDDDDAPLVRCIDLAAFIESLPEGPVILKLDCEGAEFDLLEHLIETGAVARLSRVLIEWHDGEPPRRRAIEEGLRRAGIVYEQWRW